MVICIALIDVNFPFLLTDSLVPRVEELCEGRSGSLALDHLRALLVGRQLAQHAGSHPLHVLDLVVEELQDERLFLIKDPADL